MSEALLQLLRENPNCRVTFGSAKPRRKPESGDVKMKRGKVYVRQQQMSQGCYCVTSRGPRWEWVPEDQARSSYRSGWVQPARKKAAKKSQPAQEGGAR